MAIIDINTGMVHTKMNTPKLRGLGVKQGVNFL